MRRRALSLLVFAALVGASCYERRVDPCRITCAASCPAGLTCGVDGFCHAPGEAATCAPDATPGDAADGPAPDAADPDASLVDADPDAIPSDGTPPLDGAIEPGVVTAIAAGGARTCAIDDQAQLWCWGANRDGEVGDPTAGGRALLPRMVATGVTAVAAGPHHACAIVGGRMKCWGRNLDGQCGQPAAGVVTAPTEIASATTGWIAVAVGERHSCGIRQITASEQRVYCWGGDDRGARGNGPAVSTGPTPTEVAGAITTWTAIAAAGDHACGLANGRAWCWGDNAAGQLATGDAIDRDAPSQAVAGDNSSRQYDAIATADATTCGVHNGALLCWGDNSRRQFGDATPSSLTPHQVAPSSAGWSAVALGSSSACGIVGGAPRCWGGGERGAIGDGGFDDRTTPTAIVGVAQASAVAVGGDHACVIDGDGRARCWGDNAAGQLGDGTHSAQFAPAPVAATGGWIDVVAGDRHTCARRDAGTRVELWCWGHNRGRQVDPGAAVGAVIASPRELLATRDWLEVAAGRAHTCAIERAGTERTLWCWGDNARGQVGTGAAAALQPPGAITVPPFTTWADLVAAGDASCAQIGAVRYCWGANDRGQLGVVDTVDRVRPAAASGSWRAVALGATFGCGRDDSDRVLCWGDDRKGQLGLGAGDQSTSTPTVTAIGPFTSVGAGAGHVCAGGAGSLACWGDNSDGETGQIPSGPVEVPTAVAATTGWRAPVGGRAHSCGITLSGRIACWGANDRGQLGSDQPSSSAPTLVGNLTWSVLAAGADHTCGISGGTIYCWGDNALGQLGTGATARATPAPALVP